MNFCKILSWVLFGLLCSQLAVAKDTGYTITATIGMIGDVVAEVAGDRAEVKTLLNSGVDPHLYKPTRSDVITLQQSDVVFYHGLNLEGKMEDVFKRIQKRGKAVFGVGNLLLSEKTYALEKEEHYFDPHIWMDVRAWQKVTAIIAECLIEYDPEGAAIYRANANAYQAELEKLHQYAKESFASIPRSQAVLITAHDAFQYLGRAYGIQVKGVQGISTESETGLHDLEKKISFVVQNQIPAIFVESSVSDKNIRALIEGAAAQGHRLKIGGELFSDAMGAVGTYAGTYIGMIDHNVTTIVEALGGTVPANGLNGKLTHQSAE